MRVKEINRSEAVNAANGKVANRYLLCSVAGRAARGLQVSGKLSSQAITEAFHLVGDRRSHHTAKSTTCPWPRENESDMTFNSTLLIALSLMVGWAVQARRRRRQVGLHVLTLLVSVAALVLAIRS